MERNAPTYDAVQQRISEQERRIRRQERLVFELIAKGSSSAGKAEALLDVMKASLATLRASSHFFENPN
jgi:hypothetical protein